MRATRSIFRWSMRPSASSTSSLMCIKTTSQMIRLPAPGPCPVSTTSFTRHSSCTGLSFTRKGFTSSEGSGVKPAFSNSFTSGGYSVLASDICCTIA